MATHHEAEYWLDFWAQQMKARKGSDLYEGNIDAGQYRPEDDPHPNAFVVCQIDGILKELGETAYGIAWHYYVYRLPLHKFREGERQAKQWRAKVVVRVMQTMDTDTRYESLPIPKDVARHMLRIRRVSRRAA